MTSKLNKFLAAQQPFAQTVVTLATIGALVFTGYQTYISRLALEISQRQFVQQQTPLWEFDVNDRGSLIKIGTRTPDVRLEQAYVTYPEALSDYEGLHLFAPSSFSAATEAGATPSRWDVGVIGHALEVICAASPVRDAEKFPVNIILWPERGSSLRAGLPAVLDVLYTYRGESKQAKILYLLPISGFREKDQGCAVSLGYPKLVRDLLPDEEPQTVLSKQLNDASKEAVADE